MELGSLFGNVIVTGKLPSEEITNLAVAEEPDPCVIFFKDNVYPISKRIDLIQFTGSPEHCDTIVRIIINNVNLRRDKALTLKSHLSDNLSNEIEKVMGGEGSKNDLQKLLGQKMTLDNILDIANESDKGKGTIINQKSKHWPKKSIKVFQRRRKILLRQCAKVIKAMIQKEKTEKMEKMEKMGRMEINRTAHWVQKVKMGKIQLEKMNSKTK